LLIGGDRGNIIWWELIFSSVTAAPQAHRPQLRCVRQRPRPRHPRRRPTAPSEGRRRSRPIISTGRECVSAGGGGFSFGIEGRWGAGPTGRKPDTILAAPPPHRTALGVGKLQDGTSASRSGGCTSVLPAKEHQGGPGKTRFGVGGGTRAGGGRRVLWRMVGAVGRDGRERRLAVVPSLLQVCLSNLQPPGPHFPPHSRGRAIFSRW